MKKRSPSSGQNRELVHGGCWFTLGLGHLLGTPALGRWLTQAKNGDEQFWKEKFHAVNGKAQHALMNCTVFFLFEEWVGREKDFLFFSLIPKLFPNIFPVMFQMVTPQFYPIWFAQSSTPMYLNNKDGIQG